MPVCRTDLEVRLADALRRISRYQSPESIRRTAQSRYGLDADEAVGMAYENVIHDRPARLRLRCPACTGRHHRGRDAQPPP